MKILDILKDLGFQMREVSDFGYGFSYEGINLLFTPEEDDDEFLRLTAPCIYESDEDKKPFVLDLINEVNCKIKYSKTCLVNNDVWAMYEIRLASEADLEEHVRYGILILQATVRLFRKYLDGDGEDSSNESDKENDSEI